MGKLHEQISPIHKKAGPSLTYLFSGSGFGGTGGHIWRTRSFFMATLANWDGSNEIKSPSFKFLSKKLKVPDGLFSKNILVSTWAMTISLRSLTFASERLVIGIFFGHGLQLRSDFFLRYLLQHQ
jgi:hypothetical protein